MLDHEKSQSYNTAVGGIGYAGILTIFSLTHEMMPVWAKATVAALLLFSLTLYVGWVVGQMFVNVRVAQGHGEGIKKAMMSVWHLVLLGTIVPALVAASFMAVFYFRKIVGLG